MEKEVYGRAIILRNCGRFLNIASDFGSEYKTHPFLTEQMAYAGLTRENGLINEQELQVEKGEVPDDYDFNMRYGIPNGRYFTCGYIIDKEKYKVNEIKLGTKNRNNADINDFNSIDETAAGVQTNNRLPKYGNIEWILPNNYFLTFAFSTDKEYLETYYLGQSFYMGKKRTMFQIDKLSKITIGEIKNEVELILPVQLSSQEIEKFEYYNILTLTQRYILVKGKIKAEIENYVWNPEIEDLKEISLPVFFVNKYL